jgi:hypothetical protein
MPGFGRKIPSFWFQKITLILWGNVLPVAFFFHHLSHFGEGLPQLAYNQAETPGR